MVTQRPRVAPLTTAYTVAITAFTVAVLLGAIVANEELAHDRLWLVIASVVTMIVVMRFPIAAPTIDAHTVIHLSAGVYLAIALLFEPPVAIITIAIAALLGEFCNRRPGQWISINVSQTILQVAAASVILAGSGWRPEDPRLTPGSLLAILAAGLAMRVINVLAVALLISMEERQPFLKVMPPMMAGFDWGQRISDLGELAMGTLVVILIDDHLLAIALLMVPFVAMLTTQGQYNHLLRQVQKSLRGAEASLATAQRIAHLGSWEWEIAHDTWHWSDEMYRILGVEPQAFPASGDRYLSTIQVDDRATFREMLDRICEDGISESLDCRITQPGGVERVVNVRLEATRSPSGAIQSIVGTVLDVTERKQLETRLSHQAFHDPLTGLSNRVHFLERLELVNRRDTIAVLFIDLDNFKAVNDRLGHDAGDRLLCIVAERLRACLRDGDLAARLGGDEFTVLLRGLTHSDDAGRVAQRILQALCEPILLDGHPVLVTPSIGIAVNSPNVASPEELLRAADTAMYRAKHSGKARYATFDPDHEQGAEAAILARAS